MADLVSKRKRLWDMSDNVMESLLLGFVIYISLSIYSFFEWCILELMKTIFSPIFEFPDRQKSRELRIHSYAPGTVVFEDGTVEFYRPDVTEVREFIKVMTFMEAGTARY